MHRYTLPRGIWIPPHLLPLFGVLRVSFYQIFVQVDLSDIEIFLQNISVWIFSETKFLFNFHRFVCSAVVDIEGLLEIDAYVLSAGLKISSTLRSATSLKINFKSLDGNGVDLRFGLPTKEDDFLTMKTEAFTTIRERGLSPVEVPLNSNGKK